MAWYCVATYPKKEHIAYASLASVGFDAFSPIIEEPLKCLGVTRTRSAPLFPGYIFTEANLLDLSEQLTLWRQSHYPTGIHNLVNICGQPSEVPDEVMEEIMIWVGPDSVFVPPTRRKRDYEHLKAGQDVKVVHGPYTGWIAKFAEMKGSERSIVMLRMFDRDCRVEIERAYVEPITIF